LIKENKTDLVKRFLLENGGGGMLSGLLYESLRSFEEDDFKIIITFYLIKKRLGFIGYVLVFKKVYSYASYTSL